MIHSVAYCEELMELVGAKKKQRPGIANSERIMFHTHNAKFYTYFITLEILLALVWDVMSHPPYNPNVTPSVYHFLRNLQNLWMATRSKMILT